MRAGRTGAENISQVSLKLLNVSSAKSNLIKSNHGIYMIKENIIDNGEKNMKEQKLLERITLNPDVMTGKPAIKGTRLIVQFILGLLAHGASVEEIIEEYKGLTTEDIRACLLFATESLDDTTFMPLTAEAC